MGSAEQKLYYGGDILKELGQVFTYNGSKVTTTTPGQDGNDPGRIDKNLLTDTGSGIYASWAFKVNHAGELKGDYRVLEEIPEGMELAYIRIKWLGQEANKQETKVVSKEIDTIGTKWEKKENTSTSDNNQSQNTIYYVRNDKKQALIKLGGFVDKKIEDQCSVDVQVVCRVTDKDGCYIHADILPYFYVDRNANLTCDQTLLWKSCIWILWCCIILILPVLYTWKYFRNRCRYEPCIWNQLEIRSTDHVGSTYSALLFKRCLFKSRKRNFSLYHCYDICFLCNTGCNRRT